MKSAELSQLITGFFLTRLGAERNVSRNTALAYRDRFMACSIWTRLT